MSPLCYKILAGNKLWGRYLARVWRVLDRRCHECGDVPQLAGSRQAAVCLIDGKVRCVTGGWRRRCAALPGGRLDAVG